jgi:hypothetical protein
MLQGEPLTLTVTLERGQALMVYVGDSSARLCAGQSWIRSLDPHDQRWKEVSR